MKAFIELPIRILTHNIRYATTSPFKGEELWPVRAPRLLNELRYNTLYNPEAFICLQEVLHNQLTDIMSSLNNNATESYDEWAYIGVGRDDGKTAGEYSPIIYRPAVWKLEEFQTVWLSETPDRPSKGWDAASIRIVTIGVFQHRQSGSKLVAMNTHMDDQGSKARLEGAKLIVKEIGNYTGYVDSSGGGPLPLFLAGDFNSEPHQEAYEVFNAADSPVHDLRESVPEAMRYGHNNTFTGFGFEGEPNKRIDFLFLKKGSWWQARGYAVLESRFDDGVYNSDHRAVVGDVVLQY
jgi:endonuclease/exonuclease/phosphatase family metal-dependent hydrolase